MNGTKWVAILAVILMIGSMAIYVITDDESIQPGVSPGTTPEQPIMAEDAM